MVGYTLKSVRSVCMHVWNNFQIYWYPWVNNFWQNVA